ncbi:MAG: ABC transporter permease [Bacillota bacterium]
MSYLTKLAFKNISRHKLRTIVSISAIVVAVIVVVFARGLINGMINSTYDDYFQYQTGHIRVIDEEYEKKERLLSLNHTVGGFNEEEGLDTMIGEFNNIDGVRNVIPRLKFGGAVSTGDELFEMMGWGVDPQKELEFTDLKNNIVEGRMVNRGQREVVMGDELLNDLNKNVGDKVTILYNTAFSSFKGATFEIVGRVDSNLRLLNEKLFYLPLDIAQHQLYLDGQVTEILFDLEDRKIAGEVSEKTRNILENKGGIENYRVIPWRESGGIIPFFDIAKNIYNVIYIFIVGLASFVVINTLIMIVKERTQEIGMMSSLGLKKSGILKLFIYEGTAMGVIGSFIGAVLGGILTKFLATTGLDFSQAFEGIGEDIMMSTVIYPEHSISNMIFAFFLGVIIVAIASIIPARRAANLEPTDALRDIE